MRKLFLKTAYVIYLSVIILILVCVRLFPGDIFDNVFLFSSPKFHCQFYLQSCYKNG